jgi:hypothetical protein
LGFKGLMTAALGMGFKWMKEQAANLVRAGINRGYRPEHIAE